MLTSRSGHKTGRGYGVRGSMGWRAAIASVCALGGGKLAAVVRRGDIVVVALQTPVRRPSGKRAMAFVQRTRPKLWMENAHRGFGDVMRGCTWWCRSRAPALCSKNKALVKVAPAVPDARSWPRRLRLRAVARRRQGVGGEVACLVGWLGVTPWLHLCCSEVRR
jgi:hypothetical protein